MFPTTAKTSWNPHPFLNDRVRRPVAVPAGTAPVTFPTRADDQAHRVSKSLRCALPTSALLGAAAHRSCPLLVELASAGFTVKPLPARRHVALSCVSLSGASEGFTVEMVSTNQQHPTKGVTRPQVTSGTAAVAGNRGAGTPPAAAASEHTPEMRSEAALWSVRSHRERSPLSPDNQLGMVGAAAVDRSRPGPTLLPDRPNEFSRVKGVCPRMTNTSRMTARHLDTMDDLLDCIEAFVKAGTITTIEELDLLRKARQASDEAQLLDYAYALQMCAMKENGIWGQRFHQLAREAEAFRAGMVEREEAADDVHRQAA